MKKISRRSFIRQSSVLGVPFVFPAGLRETMSISTGGPLVIASGNGLRAVKRAMERIRQGASALDAVIAGVNLVEEDPEDITVGYGGLPNFDGIVELDAAVMHGPWHRAGAVGALQGVKYPSKVARVVMERSDHVLLVGEGAQRFARMHGFPIENLLTEKARKIWVKWRETLSTKDDYLPPHGLEDKHIGSNLQEFMRHYGTIHCSAIDLSGHISAVTTTSGLAFKIPGRVGDSPIIGAGLYVDNEVGAAGSTGRGEANLENLSCMFIVEQMRQGKSPEEACLAACERIAHHTKLARLLDEQGKPRFNVKFYAFNRVGVFGGAELRRSKGGGMAVADASGARLVPLAALFD